MKILNQFKYIKIKWIIVVVVVVVVITVVIIVVVVITVVIIVVVVAAAYPLAEGPLLLEVHDANIVGPGPHHATHLHK
jgi:hypothetical protein